MEYGCFGESFLLGGDDGYTDLAVERRRCEINCKGVDFRRERTAGGSWERLKILDSNGERAIGRPCGIYDTLSVLDMDKMDFDTVEDASDEVARELCRLFDFEGVYPSRILVVGLGNSLVTADGVGCAVCSVVEPTLQIKRGDEKMFSGLECSEIAVLCPSVENVTGMRSSDIVKGVCDRLSPDVIIAVDSIISRSRERLGNTVQFSNTGICPGSGIGAHSVAIDKRSMGVPVISVGVPTVIDASNLINDGGAKPALRDYLVCPKDVQSIVKVSGKIIGGGINQAFGICF